VRRNHWLWLVVVGIISCTFVALFGAPPRAWAQQAAGAITGTITDPSGSIVAGATVTAHDVDRGTVWTTRSDAAGIYEFPQITVGRIELKVEATGFASQVRTPFVLVLNQVARVDFKLSVGEVNETVTVSGLPPLLQTDATELGSLIDAHTTTALPLATRDINQLTLLVPGVISPNIFAFQSPQTTFGTGRPYVNGAREQDNNFSLDGMDTNQPDNNEVAYVPGPDAIQEFNIITSNAPADFGNYIGGVIVETLKSGTNQFHGDAFEFLRNTVLDANSWQNKTIGVFTGVTPPRNPLQWNEFGGTIGGPVIKDKLFFFADVQASRYNQSATTVPFAPIPAPFRTGDFSSLCTAGFTNGLCNNPAEQLYNPASSATPAARTPFLNNQVPASSAAAQAILASPLFPAASVSSYLEHNYVNSYQGDAKIDWQVTPNDHITGRYSQQYVINNTTNSIALLPSLTREFPLKNFVVDYVRTISPSLVNDVRAGVQDFPANDQKYTNPTGQNLPQTFGIPGVQDTILPDLNFNGVYSDVGNADLVEIFHDTTVEAEDALTWTHGRHVIHGGFEYYHYLINDLYPGNQGLAGQFTFDGQFTGNSVTGTGGGNAVADFLLGLPEEVQEGTPDRFHLRNSLFGAFVQDNWRVSEHLTLNLGLRYELTTPRGDKDSLHNVNFDLNTGAPEVGTNYQTYTGIDNWQPRIGFAWQPASLPHAVFRGAYDISTYMEGNGVGNMAVVNPPYIISRDEINLGLAEPLTTLDQGYSAFPSATCTAAALGEFSPNCLGSGVTVHETNPHIQPAVDQQWNFTVQQQFGANATVSAGYVGNKIDHLTDINYWNQKQLVGGVAVPGPYSQPLVATGASVRYNDSAAIQRYNALQLTAVERNFHGLDMQVSYTWSKCLSNSLGYFGQYGDEEGVGVSQTNGGTFFFQNDYDIKADYGKCITDAPSVFNGYVLYNLPFGKGRQFAGTVSTPVNEVIGGWSVASDFNFHSGFAINTSAPDQSGTGSLAYRPDCVSGVSQYGSDALENIAGSYGKQFLNAAAVSLPAAGTFGSCQVGSFRGPGLKTADLNLTKAFPITQKVNLQFLTQFINLTNTPIFSAPASSCSPSCNGVITTGASGGGAGTAGSFGLAQSQDPGRQIQFALKLIY
jgi:Carboxypeptidase regulatory-like domain/TonB dependent receptor